MHSNPFDIPTSEACAEPVQSGLRPASRLPYAIMGVAALSSLLAGTGLRYRYLNATTVTIEARSDAAPSGTSAVPVATSAVALEAAPAEEGAGLVDQAGLLGLADAADAGGGAVFDDIVGTMFEVSFAGPQRAADPEAEAFIEPSEHGAKSAGMSEWPEVAGAIVLAHADGAESWPGFLKVNPHHEKAFVIAEIDVVTRPVFFD